jgi:hypothetical protein
LELTSELEYCSLSVIIVLFQNLVEAAAAAAGEGRKERTVGKNATVEYYSRGQSWSGSGSEVWVEVLMRFA